jgi:hypothetical protein
MYMRYIVCTDRQRKGTCAFCGFDLKDSSGYVHNLETGEWFDSAACAEADIYATAMWRKKYVPFPTIIQIIGEHRE